MQMIEHKLFPTLVGKFEDFLFPEQCEEFISNINLSNKLNEHPVFTGNAVTSFNTQFDITNEFEENFALLFNTKLQLCMDQYIAAQRCLPLKVQNTWITYQYPHSNLVRHTHPGSHISGVLYLKVDEKSSPLTFYNPNPFVEFTTRKKPYSEFSTPLVQFHPKIGELIIFPSWLPHGSNGEDNMSEERIIFSFNTETIDFKN